MNDFYNKKRIEGLFSMKYLLLFFFTSEALTKILYYCNSGFYNVSAAVKGLFILFTLVFVFKQNSQKQRQILYFLLILGAFFLIGQFFFEGDKNFKDAVYYNLVFFLRYILVFILCISLDGIYHRKFKTNVFKVFEAIIIVNTIFLIVGATMGLDIFSTYKGYRFGYNGLFLVPSIATYFYSLALTYYSYKIVKQRKGHLMFFVLTLCAFLVGTKALFLFLMLTLFNLFIYFKLYKYLWTYIIIVFSIACGVIFRELIMSKVASVYEVIYNVYRKDGIITMLTSYRDINLTEKLPEVYERMNGFNFLFGGTDFSLYRIEFEIIDVLLFFGIIGGGLYLYFYFTRIIRFNCFDIFSKLQIIILLITALLSGTFFNNGAVGLYLIIVLNSLMNKVDEVHN